MQHIPPLICELRQICHVMQHIQICVRKMLAVWHGHREALCKAWTRGFLRSTGNTDGCTNCSKYTKINKCSSYLDKLSLRLKLVYSYRHLLNNYSLYDLEIRKKKKKPHTHTLSTFQKDITCWWDSLCVWSFNESWNDKWNKNISTLKQWANKLLYRWLNIFIEAEVKQQKTSVAHDWTLQNCLVVVRH